jgi:hypothetical protein
VQQVADVDILRKHSLPRSLVAEHVLDRSLGQRHEEPLLEHAEEHDRQADADGERRQPDRTCPATA